MGSSTSNQEHKTAAAPERAHAAPERTQPAQGGSAISALADPMAASPRDLLALQRAAGNQAVARLLGGPPAMAGHAPQIQRAGGKVDPGQQLPGFEHMQDLATERFKEINTDKTGALAAANLKDARQNITDPEFMGKLFKAEVQKSSQSRPRTLPPTPDDLEQIEAELPPVLKVAASLPAAMGTWLKATAKTAATKRKLGGAFYEATAKYTRHNYRSESRLLGPEATGTGAELASAFLTSRRGVKIEEQRLPNKKERTAWAALLKKLPTIANIMSAFKSKRPIVGKVGAAWMGGAALTSQVSTSLLNDHNKGAEEGNIERKDMDNGQTLLRIGQADSFLRALVQPSLLATMPPPKIVVHLRLSEGSLFDFSGVDSFRAYQTGNEVHVAQDDSMSTIVHEVGHYLENNLPSELWHDIHLMIESRHVQSAGKTDQTAGHGAMGMSEEGRYKGEYAATGKYTSSAYGGEGATEVLSMTLEFLSDPKRLATMIDKDPQQTAIVLRGIIPDEYRNPAKYGLAGLTAFDKFLPNA